MKRILICDDEMIIREFLAELLQDEVNLNAEFVLAKDGNEGIENLQSEQKFDLIICDMNMKYTNGDKVHLMNQQTQRAPFIMLSGHDQKFFNDLDGFNLENKCTVLSKPWNEEQLIQTVKEFLVL